MREYLSPLIEAFRKLANEERAQWSKHYLKDQFDFLGIPAVVRRKIVKEFLHDEIPMNSAQLRQLCLYLWKLPYREYQHTAVDILDKYGKKLEKEDITWIEQLIVTKSWWDTVDGLAVWICGRYFQLYPEQIQPVTERWMNSGNLWLERSCLLYQLKYKAATNTERLTAYIEPLADRKEFFIRKAIGWVLREYSKTNPDWVKGFLDSHTLSGLSRKEAEKYLY